jgi:CheY-like chemotaxis protein
MRVLIVEDNPLNQELARDLLEASGHEVKVIESANEFDALLTTTEQFDVVLMDILLPDADGVELLERWRAHPERTGAIVAVTALVLPQDTARYTEAGFDGVLPKPINTRDFVETVEKYANSRGAPHGHDPSRR